MSDAVRRDMTQFLALYRDNPVDPSALKIRGVSAVQVIEVLDAVYGQAVEAEAEVSRLL